MDFDLSIAIRRPPEAIYAMLADIQEYAGAPGSPVPEMEKMPPGPTSVGTRWREVVRLIPMVTMTVWSEVTDLVPGRRLAESFRGPWMTGRLVYEIDPTLDGAVLRQRETLTPHGPLRLMAGAMTRMLRPRLETRLRDIRAVLEKPSA